MSTLLNRTLWVALVVAAVAMTGCAKKPPAPVAAPPTPTQEQVPVPAPTQPAPVPTPPAPTTGTATVADLRTVYFELDSYALDDAARSALDANAKLLRENSDLRVRIEGHCDERGTVEYNMSLGQRRAEAVRDYLLGAGVASDRLSTISYGKERPVAEGHDESAWSRNRRAEFTRP